MILGKVSFVIMICITLLLLYNHVWIPKDGRKHDCSTLIFDYIILIKCLGALFELLGIYGILVELLELFNN